MTEPKPNRNRPHRRARRALVATLAVTVFTVAVFMLLEGAAGTLLMVWDVAMVSSPGLQSRQHAVHDTLLGWINTPGFRDEDMYGPGNELVINSLSIRDHAETPLVEPGVVRIVCSGDSFTFGVGVANDDTWCAMLERRDPHIRSLNLGHAGYGVDQAYLRHRRDGEQLAHDVHIFAFIPDDIRRVRLARFAGYDKPYYSIENDRLELRNVPVPELSKAGSYVLRAREKLVGLHLVRFTHRLSTRFFGERQEERPNTDDEARMIALELMDSLNVSAREYDRLMVFVLLPQTYNSSHQYDELSSHLASEMAARNLVYLDLRTPARRLPADSLNAMFNPMASGHFSIRGNERIAESLWEALTDMPGFNERLATVRD